jgi:4-hydroxybenzoate polyprenyltransferase
MRSAGCIANDLADQRFDAKVQRTKQRPLVTGAVAQVHAFYLLLGWLLLAFILVLQLNLYALKVAFLALMLTLIYPLMKRYTYFPQIILGAAFGCSIPMAFAATLNTIPTIAWILYLATLLWVVAYDTQYAMVDKHDDVRVGIKSTAIVFGKYDRWIIPALQVVTLGLFAWVGYLARLNYYFYIFVLIALGLVVYQWTLIFNRDPKNCFKAFLNNNALGACLFLGIVFGYF